MRILKLGAAFAVLATSPVAHAATDDAEAWINFWATGPIDGKILGSFDSSTRFSDRPGDLGVNQVRGLVGYQVAPKVSLWAGYTFAETKRRNLATVSEHRPTAQVLWQLGKVGKGSLLSRTRLEMRQFEGRNDTGWRVREMLRFTHPLGGKRAPTLALSTENFFHLNSTDWGARSGFDQSRNFVGLNVPIGKKFQFEGGYMLRYVKRSNVPDRVDHIVPVTLVWRF